VFVGVSYAEGVPDMDPVPDPDPDPDPVCVKEGLCVFVIVVVRVT